MNRAVGSIPEEVSAALVRARRVLNLSVAQAADLALMSRARWTQIETRAIRPTPRTLCNMAKAVGLDPAQTLAKAGLDPSGLSLSSPLPRRRSLLDESLLDELIELTDVPELTELEKRDITAFLDDLRRRRDY